jgi:segregation and condensation protein A
MAKAEKTVPWWRKALQFALGGIRSGFGLFQRGAKPGEVGEGQHVPVASLPRVEVKEAELEREREPAEPVSADQENAIEIPQRSESLNELEDPAPEIPLPIVVDGMDRKTASNLPETELAEEGIEATEIASAGIELEGVEGFGAAEIEQEKGDAVGEPETEETIDLEAIEAEAIESEMIVEEAIEVKTIEESTDEELAEAQTEESETVEADVTGSATGTNAEAEGLVEEVKAVEVPANEAVVSAESAEPEAAHAEEAAPEEEIEMKGAVAVETANAEEEAANAAEPQLDPVVEEAVHVEREVVEEAMSKEMVEAPVAEAMAEEAQTVEQTEAQPSMEEIRVPVVAETVAEPESEATTISGREAGPGAGAEVLVEAAAAPAQLELIPKPHIDEKAAAKLAEQQRRRKEAEEESPFSVIVGQVYEGPLDLLLDLIRKQDIDIYDIPIAKITAQFLAYVNQLKASDVDVAGEFIYTASLLIHIKSKMLLPRMAELPGEAPEDPRRELVERLLEHERFKNAAQMLQQKQMMEAASWSNPGQRDFVSDEGAEPEIAADTVDLVRVFREILERARNRPVLDVEEDTVTVGQMIRFLGRRLTMEDKPIALRKLLSHTRSERALIAMFLALLELVRLQAVLLWQDKAFSEIFIKKHAGFESVMDEGLANARDDWR